MSNGIVISKEAFLNAKGDTEAQREMLFDGIEHITKLAPVIQDNKIAIGRMWKWLTAISVGISGIAFFIIRAGLLMAGG